MVDLLLLLFPYSKEIFLTNADLYLPTLLNHDNKWSFFNLYLPTLFSRNIHMDVCVWGGLRVSKIKKDQIEEAKDWHCFSNSNGLISVTLAVVRS